MPGRLNAVGAGPALASSDVVLGAGWGTQATCAITGNDQRGVVTVTSAGGSQALATATVTLTFKRAWPEAPIGVVIPVSNTQVTTGEAVIDVTDTATTLSWKHSVLPVASKVYTYNYVVMG